MESRKGISNLKAFALASIIVISAISIDKKLERQYKTLANMAVTAADRNKDGKLDGEEFGRFYKEVKGREFRPVYVFEDFVPSEIKRYLKQHPTSD